MRISGLTHAASAPALLRFALRVATHAQGWLPAGWLAFTGRGSNPLDHCERFPITWSSPFPVLLTLRTFQTTTAELLRLSEWLAVNGCTHVAMEATGIYWKPVWHILDDGEFESVTPSRAGGLRGNRQRRL